MNNVQIKYVEKNEIKQILQISVNPTVGEF
jgi:hypothetical protein